VRPILASGALGVLLVALASMPAASQGRGGTPAPAAKPAASKPAPRLANGKPSMTGVWDNTRRADVTNKAIPGFVKELPYTAWGKAKWDGYDQFMQTNGDYVGNCLPFGMSRSIYGPHPLQIIHDNDNLVMLFEQNSMFHIVPTDGRAFTKDLPASWFGESVGRWDGDTLVVETQNINGFTRVDTIGHPMSARGRITQTFKRVNFDTIEHTFTLNDPKAYTAPWTVHDTWALEPETKLLEYACMENNRAFYEGRIKAFVPPDDVD
jgi:hypothetical protein